MAGGTDHQAAEKRVPAHEVFHGCGQAGERLGVDVPILRAALCNLQVYEARRGLA